MKGEAAELCGMLLETFLTLLLLITQDSAVTGFSHRRINYIILKLPISLTGA